MIYIVRRGWHIDVGFAVETLSPPVEQIAAKFPGARYLSFGFGDRRYLMKSNHTVPAMLRALWPGAGVILVTGLHATPEAAFGAGQVIELHVTPEQNQAAQDALWQSVQAESGVTTAVPTLAMGPYAGSLYLASSERYSAVHTCNTWAAGILERAGLPIRRHGVIFSGQVWRRATALASAQFSCRAAWSRSDRPRWFLNSAAPRPSFSAAAADCCY